MRVSLKDQAGNHDPTALRTACACGSTTLRRGRLSPGVANGWLNAVERAAFQQNVKLADDAFTPVSGIAGYSLTRTAPTPTTDRGSGEEVGYPINDLPEGVNTIKARAVSGAGVAPLR